MHRLAATAISQVLCILAVMKTTRRELLGAVAASVIPGWRLTAADSSFDPWVEVNAENLRHNVQVISQRVAGRPILAVIKNNGYGLGVVNAAQQLEPLSQIAGVAVVKLHEAVALRDAGIKKPVLLMGPFDEKNLEEAVARDIMPMVYTPVGATLDRISQKLRKPILLHVCVDTGIGRVGIPYRAAPELIRDLVGRKSVALRGVMMTFTEDPEFDKEQFHRYQTLCTSLEKEGINLGRKHTCSSFGLFQRPEAFLDMVRPGMALYGVYSEPEFRGMGILDLRPAMALRARVVYVKQLHEGESAGYERAYMARQDTWVATIPVGHTDGWPREAAKGAKVRINGALYPVVASVSASHSIIELGPEKRAEIGDTVTCFDWQTGSRPEDVAESCKSSVYDLTMHLNPLLPRRVV